MDSFDRMKDLVICIECEKLTSEVKTLPCFHIMCINCLRSYIKKHKKLACPSCWTTIPGDFETATAWPMSGSFIQRLVSTAKKIKEVKGMRTFQCDACGHHYGNQSTDIPGCQSMESGNNRTECNSEPTGGSPILPDITGMVRTSKFRYSKTIPEFQSTFPQFEVQTGNNKTVDSQVTPQSHISSTDSTISQEESSVTAMQHHPNLKRSLLDLLIWRRQG